MNQPSPVQPPLSDLNQQINRLPVEIVRLFDAILNCLFALNNRGTRRRRRLLIGAFLLTVFLVGFFRQDFETWKSHLRNVFYYLFTLSGGFTTNPVLDFAQFLEDTYINIEMFRYLVIFILTFVIALRLAAMYLADIFERRIKIASDFIRRVALWGGNPGIRISEGDLDPKSEDSPISAIGGPGRVIVDLDSAALFERPDGRPHVIGPTTNGPAILDGFERFRQAIDLRDHRLDIDIPSRSLDGIPVEAVNVNFIFSVVRSSTLPPPPNQPYSFLNNGVIERLVYGQASSVNRLGTPHSKTSKAWTKAMSSLVTRSLAGFMSDHDLTEYFASYGMPELQAAQEQVTAIRQAAENVLRPGEVLTTIPMAVDPPLLTPRPDLKAMLFNDFASGFPIQAEQRGVELHWIGIGSWKTPSQIIPEKHLEAWKLSVDNLVRRNLGIQDSPGEYITRFIQDIPLSRYSECKGYGWSHDNVMYSLLVGYREQFIKLLNLLEKKQNNPERLNRATLNIILEALRHINWILNQYRRRRPTPPPSPPGEPPPPIPPPPLGPQPGGAPPFDEAPWDIPEPPDEGDSGTPPPPSTKPGRQDPSTGSYSVWDIPGYKPGIHPAGESSPNKDESGKERYTDFLNTQLLILVQGNKEVAERLIEAERQKFPKESLKQWIERAIESIKRNRL